MSSREGDACVPMDSSSTAVAHRDGRLHQRPAACPHERTLFIYSCRPVEPSALAVVVALWQHAGHWRSAPILHLVGNPHASCGHLPSGTGSRFDREMIQEPKAGELAAAHQYMRFKLQRTLISVALCHPHKRQIGPTCEIQIGWVGLSRSEPCGLVNG